MYSEKYLYFVDNNNNMYKIPEDIQVSLEKSLSNHEKLFDNIDFNNWLQFMNFRDGSIIKYSNLGIVELESKGVSEPIIYQKMESKASLRQTSGAAVVIIFIGVIIFVVGMTTLFDWGIFAVFVGVAFVIWGLLLAKKS